MLIFTVLLTFSSYGQFKSGKVIYKGVLDVQPRIDRIMADTTHSNRMRDMLLKGLEMVQPVRFTMIFTKNECSIKKEKEPIEIEGKTTFNLAYNQDYAIEIYTNLSKNEKCTYRTLMGEEVLIIAKNDTKWKLLNETKKIGKYLCYKAVSSVTVATMGGDEKLSFTAWYTPQIPVPFTPRGFNNLPGLLIQMKYENFTYTAEEIKLSDKDITITPPNRGERLTPEELLQREREIWQGIKEESDRIKARKRRKNK